MSDSKTPTNKANAAGAKINWNDSEMNSVYANVCNAVGSREEVVMFFGISNPGGVASDGTTPEVDVQLSTRVILSPFAAKRLSALLGQVVNQYESRFGALGDVPGAKPTN